jgi:uncharacterized protein YbjT (DUF2867 family)
MESLYQSVSLPQGKYKMKVLVTGATGKVGSLLVTELIERGVDVRIFTRNEPNPNAVPNGIEVVVGDLLDTESVARAMAGIDKLFLLNAVGPSELTEALIGFGMARRARVKHVTYLSAFKADRIKDSPNLATKYAVECAIGNGDMPFTFLRPNYFIQNDRQLIPMIAETGLYQVPLGEAGVSAVDIRDVAEAAAISLTEKGHVGQTYDLVGPTVISGPSNAALWSQLMGKPIKYVGHDLERWEAQVRGQMPSWTIFDMRTMFEGFFSYGYKATAVEIDRATKLLGHAPRSYEDFATQAASEWKRKREM